jgi:glucokinase
MTQLLAGDIGGTKTILRWVESSPAPDQNAIPQLTTRYEAQYSSQAYGDLVPMVQEFLQAAAQAIRTVPTPQKACFGIAGPVEQNRSQLTNLSWLLAGDRLAQDLGLDQVRLINDFAAVGYGVLGLGPEDLHWLQAVEPDPQAPIAIIGAGTGLGQGFLIPQAQGHQVYPTEGGHGDFAPRSPLEFELLQYVRTQLDITRVSVERLVSGPGIVTIYQFLRDRQTTPESPEVGTLIRQWEQGQGAAIGAATGAEIDPAATIAAAQDALCRQTMELFIELYGVETGNQALRLLPYGGQYIAGGIAAKNLELMGSGQFMRAFRDKGRVKGVLDRVPVAVVLNPQVGLIGAALHAATA